MISTEPHYQQILSFLEFHDIKSSPNNLKMVLKLQDSRWDLEPDELVRTIFKVKKAQKILFKIDIQYKKIKSKNNFKILINLNLTLIKSYSFYFKF